MVYSFYDPTQPQRSLGTYMILDHVEFARSQGHPFVYLGYWIEGSRKMRYKNRFEPQERLTSKGWVRTDVMKPASPNSVMAGLVSAIHVLVLNEIVDTRHKAWHGETSWRWPNRTAGRICSTWGSPSAAGGRPAPARPTNPSARPRRA